MVTSIVVRYGCFEQHNRSGESELRSANRVPLSRRLRALAVRGVSEEMTEAEEVI